MAKHILEVAPDSAKVILENDTVRVFVVTMKRGQTLPMHSHDRGVSYSLNAGRIRSTGKGGRSAVVDVNKGDVSWSETDGMETHAVENLGGVLRELCIEFKTQRTR